MGRWETERKPFYVIKNLYKTPEDEKNQENWRPRFFLNNQNYGRISWLIKSIATEEKDIVPTKWDHTGQTITIQNLLVALVDQEWEVELQVPLYSWIARSIMNALAGPEDLNEVFFSVYNNKNWYRAISLKHSTAKEDFIVPHYSWDQQEAMIETTKVKGKVVKDYDKLTEDRVKELIPIIKKKINQVDEPKKDADDGIEIEKWATVPVGKPDHDMPANNNDNLPF